MNFVMPICQSVSGQESNNNPQGKHDIVALCFTFDMLFDMTDIYINGIRLGTGDDKPNREMFLDVNLLNLNHGLNSVYFIFMSYDRSIIYGRSQVFTFEY
jgi:hypothetical protein